MREARPRLSFPIRLGLACVLIGAVCVVAIGVVEYAAALRAERQSIVSFAEAAKRVVPRGEQAETTSASKVEQRLGALRGKETVTAWRILDRDTGHELTTSSHADDVEIARLASLENTAVWTPGPGGFGRLHGAAFRDTLVIRLPFAAHDGSPRLFEAFIDGPQRHRQAVRRVAERLGTTAAGFALLAVCVFGLAFRWVARPVARIEAQLTEPKAAPDATVPWLEALAERIESQAEQKRQTRADASTLEAMTQASPAGLLTIDGEGRIFHANPRAADRLGAENISMLLGKPVEAFVESDDRRALTETLKAEAEDPTPRQLRVRFPRRDERSDEPWTTLSIGRPDAETGRRVLVLPNPQSGDAMRQVLASQQSLLQSAMDGLPTPWLLTDPQGTIVALNRAWALAAKRPADALLRAGVTDAEAWASFGTTDASIFTEAIADAYRRKHDQAEGLAEVRGDRYVLSGQPCLNPRGTVTGFVWQLTEASNQQCPDESTSNGESLDREHDPLAEALQESRTTAQLLEASAEAIRQSLGVAAVGVAIRASDHRHNRRSEQRVTIDDTAMPLHAYRALHEAVEADLMPEAFAAQQTIRNDVTDDSPWGTARRVAGLTAAAAAALRGLGDALGVLWIAQPANHSLTDEQVQQLERFAERIAARLDTLRLTETFCELGLLDPPTGLPTEAALLRHVENLGEAEDETTPHQLLLFAMPPDASQAPASQRAAFAQSVADRLRARCRRNVFIASTGPLEFAVVVRGLTEPHAQSLADRLLASLRSLEDPLIRAEHMQVTCTRIASQSESSAIPALEGAREAIQAFGAASPERRQAS